MTSPPRRTFLWCVGTVQSPIELMPDGYVKWGEMQPHGWWAYNFASDVGIFHVSFNCHAEDLKVKMHVLKNLQGISYAVSFDFTQRPRRKIRFLIVTIIDFMHMLTASGWFFF